MGITLWNILTARFYLVLTASSFLISITILFFEWWYYAKYGKSLIEQSLINIFCLFFYNGNNSRKSFNHKHSSNLLSSFQQQNSSSDNTDDENSTTSSNHNHSIHSSSISLADNHHQMKGHISLDSKVWRNPMSLFRGSEYNQLTLSRKKEPLTFYDMNLSAQDHQTFFTCENDSGKEDMKIMLTAWRERDPEARIRSAHKALEKNQDCAPAYILLAEEEAKTIWEAERILQVALKAAEQQYKRSLSSTISLSSLNAIYSQISTQSNNSTSHQILLNGNNHLAQQRRDLNVLIYIRRRLAMCARKLGKLRESVKMMRDLIKDFPTMNLFNIHENLIEALLEMKAYADVQALLAKYDDINLPKSATICYTSALLKARNIGDKFSPDIVMKRGLSVAEMNAIEAIHRAVEFNPHVPKYLLESKKLIFPPEHILKRGDSEAISYAFFHLAHWKRIDGALNLLNCTWKGSEFWIFQIIPFPLEKGHLFYPYLTCTECTDRELLPDFHEVSVYPKKSIPFFIRFTASLCSLTALMTFIFYLYPVQIVFIIQSLIDSMNEKFHNLMDKFEFFPNLINQYMNINCWQ